MFNDKQEKEDFFESTPEVVKKPKPPKKPSFSPDDPRYYDGQESEWEHLKPAPYRNRRFILYSSIFLIVVAVLLWGYIYFFTPRVQEAEVCGYVENIEKHGFLIKSYEGVILPYKSIMDTARVYEGDFLFSTKNDHLAAQLRLKMRSGIPVRVSYETYRFRLPWLGEQKNIVVSVDSVNPSVLLPPDRRPPYQP